MNVVKSFPVQVAVLPKFYYCLCRRLSVDYQNLVKPERLKQIAESPSGWVPPSEVHPDLPFSIRRSRTNNIPVYNIIRRLRYTTKIRSVTGDIEELQRFIKYKLGEDKQCQINKTTCSLLVYGRHGKEIREWLKEVGY